MTCRDAVAVLGDFLEQALSPEIGAELEVHLRDCPPCRAYLNTYKKTRGLIARAGQTEMPEELKGRLRQFLLDQLRESKP